jgi:hypothetical protein
MEGTPVRQRLLVVSSLFVGLGLLTACEEGATLIVNNEGLDCLLERFDLTGTWDVRFDAESSTALFNCDNGLFNGLPVGVDRSLKTYGGVSVLGSVESTSFVVVGDRTGPGNDVQADELIASVEADSCLAFLRIWEADDNVYFQCIRTLNRDTSTIAASCDSAEVDDNTDGSVDDVCDLDDTPPSDIPTVTVTIR